MTVSVLLSSPLHARNVGAALRAVSCYGGGSIYFTNDRIGLDGLRRLPREERMKDYANTPWHQLMGPAAQRPIDFIRRDLGRGNHESLVPVAVELVPGAQPLNWFEHPEHALYIFGPEDGHLPQGLRTMCHQFIQIPAFHCLNLAAAVYTVLYDRMAKRVAAGLEEQPNIDGEQRGWWHDTALEEDAFT